MDVTIAGNTIRWYTDLEEELATFLKEVPPQGDNLKMWSPKLATLLIEACTLTESVFYHITSSTAVVHIARGDIVRSCMGLAEYAELYAVHRRLADRKVAFFQEPFRWVEPFFRWAGQTTRTGFKEKEPPWWSIYNKAKHRRLDGFQKATLETTITALAGALVTLVTEPELLIAAGRHQWLPWTSHGLDAEQLRRYLADFFEGKFPGTWLSPETQLFAVPLGASPLPDNIDELRHPGKQIPITGLRFRRWLGNW